MKYTLFALQVFLPLEPATQLRHQLHGMIRATGANPTGATYEEKRHFYHGFSSALAAWGPHFVYGVWDYLEDADRAEAEYEQWCSGTIEDAKSAQEAEPGAAQIYRQAAGSRFMFATMLFLMRQHGTSDRFVCEECRIPQADFFRRQTLAKLIARLPMLNFPSIRADAVFIRPGREELGVTQEELGEEHYKYLRLLT